MNKYTSIEELAKYESTIEYETFTEEVEKEFEERFEKLEDKIMEIDDICNNIDKYKIKDVFHSLRLLYSDKFDDKQKACYMNVLAPRGADLDAPASKLDILKSYTKNN